MQDPEARKKEEERLRVKAREYMRKKRQDPAFRKQHNDKVREWQQSPKGRLAVYKRQAKQRELVWGLSDEQASALFAAACHYCGEPPLPLNGIDRKDNGGDYVEGNVLPCCRTCNFAKSSRAYDEFVAWIAKAGAHWCAKLNG